MTDFRGVKAVVFDLDDTLAPSKSAMDPRMSAALAALLERVSVAIISGGRFEQFEAQALANLQGDEAALSRLHLMPTCGTRYYTRENAEWVLQYAEDLTDDEKQRTMAVLEEGARSLGFWAPGEWGPLIEDRGSQITFSALGQQAPLDAKEHWDPDFAKRKIIQADLRTRLPGMSINMGGATSIDITREGVDKAYGLKKLRDASGIPLDAMMFIGDAIFPGGNDYPAKELGLDTVRVRDPEETLSVIAAIVACQK